VSRITCETVRRLLEQFVAGRGPGVDGLKVVQVDEQQGQALPSAPPGPGVLQPVVEQCPVGQAREASWWRDTRPCAGRFMSLMSENTVT
jgi:hypothetical protein